LTVGNRRTSLISLTEPQSALMKLYYQPGAFAWPSDA